MFRSARFKLTAWYLCIIMLISMSFSVIIYQVLIREVERFARIQRFRIERGLHEKKPVPQNLYSRSAAPVPIFDPELAEETKQRLFIVLLFVNVGILGISGGLGYVLAGRTLKPIQNMIDEQNRFITDSSHELRTPLTSLKSALEVHLRDNHLTIADARKLIKESIADVNKLQSLSDELLQLSRYHKPNGYAKCGLFVLHDAVEQAAGKIQAAAKQKNITIRNNTGNTKMEGSISGISDLLVIFLDNAVKYSPRTKTVRIHSRKTGDTAEISVTDEGIGIDKNDIPHIFDRFYRADAARTKKDAGGFGLGLAIAKKIVDMHHGSIFVESNPGKGSTFTVRLPVRQSTG